MSKNIGTLAYKMMQTVPGKPITYRNVLLGACVLNNVIKNEQQNT